MYVVRARDGEISTSGLCCVICDFRIECGGVLWLEASSQSIQTCSCLVIVIKTS